MPTRQPTLEVYPAQRWATAVAERWAARLRGTPTLRMCLPTGHTPLPVYAELTAAVHRGEVRAADASVVLLDEFGGLPRDHPARCDQVLRRELLDRLDLPDTALTAFDTEAPDLDAECARVEERVASHGLGLAILGLGANGHLGLNEPGADPRGATHRATLAPETRAGATGYGIDEPPTWGLTLGLGTLLAADEIWLLVTGAAKASILEQALRGPVDASVPASYLQTHPRATVLADDRASALL